MTETELASGLIEALAKALAKELAQHLGAGTATTVTVTASATGWSPERFWACPDSVRLDVADLALGLGVSTQTVYRRVEAGMPARKVRDKTLIFVAGDVRAWLESKETIVNGAVMPKRRTTLPPGGRSRPGPVSMAGGK